MGECGSGYLLFFTFPTVSIVMAERIKVLMLTSPVIFEWLAIMWKIVPPSMFLSCTEYIHTQTNTSQTSGPPLPS